MPWREGAETDTDEVGLVMRSTGQGDLGRGGSGLARCGVACGRCDVGARMVMWHVRARTSLGSTASMMGMVESSMLWWLSGLPTEPIVSWAPDEQPCFGEAMATMEKGGGKCACFHSSRPPW